MKRDRFDGKKADLATLIASCRFAMDSLELRLPLSLFFYFSLRFSPFHRKLLCFVSVLISLAQAKQSPKRCVHSK